MEMQVSNPHRLRLLHAWKTGRAIVAERCLHIELRNQHHAGEWFRMTNAEARKIIAKWPELDAIIPVEPTVY